MKFDCSFLFAALAEKHNAVIARFARFRRGSGAGSFWNLSRRCCASSAHPVSATPNAPRSGRPAPSPLPLPSTALIPANRRHSPNRNGQPNAQPTNRRIKPSCTNPFWREMPDTPRQNRDDDQRQKSSMPIRTSAAETAYPTRCIRWMR